MSYLLQRHECDLPYPQVQGDIWQCDHQGCGKVWRVVVLGNPRCTDWRRVGRLGRWLRGIEVGG